MIQWKDSQEEKVEQFLNLEQQKKQVFRSKLLLPPSFIHVLQRHGKMYVSQRTAEPLLLR